MPFQAPPANGGFPERGPDAALAVLRLHFGASLDTAWLATLATPGGPGMHGGRFSGSIKREILNRASTSAHYFNVTTIKAGTNDRTDANAEAGHVLMVDDVGEVGVNGARVDKDRMDTVMPEASCVIETSLGNHQYHYTLDPPERDLKRFVAMKEALKRTAAIGAGVQSSSAVQYARLPSGRNVKPGKGLFETRLVAMSGRKYSLDELAEAFGIDPAALDTSGVMSRVCGASTPTTDVCSLATLMCLVEGFMPNDPAVFEDYDAYIAALAAIKGAGGDTFEAREIALDWAHQVHQDPDDDPERRWDSIHGPRIGYTALVGFARRIGIDPQGLARLCFEAGAPGVYPLDTTLAEDAKTEAQAAEEKKPRTLKDAIERARSGARIVKAKVVEDWALSALGKPRVFQQVIFPGVERGEVTVLGGQSGTMKSILLLQTALAIVTERADILGVGAIDFAGDAIIYANEDAHAVIDKRIDAIMLRHSLRSPFKHRLWLREGKLFRKTGREGAIEWNMGVLDEILDIIQVSPNIAAIALDTLASSVPGSEESNREMQSVADLCANLARAAQAAVILVHHFRKGAVGVKDESQPTQEALRGGSTFGAAARNINFVEKPTPTDVREHGLTEDDVERMTKLRPVKRSYGALGKTQWFTRDIVDIDVIDPRDGSIRQEGHPALVPMALNAVQHRLATLRAALDTIEKAVSGGMTLRKMRKSGGSGASAQSVLGMKDAEANRIVDELVAHGVIEVVDEVDTRGRPIQIIKLTGKEFTPPSGEHSKDSKDSKDENDLGVVY